MKAFFSKVFKAIFSSTKAFVQDECYNKAGLLTFYFLVSLVPFLAIALSIGKWLGVEAFLQKEILSTFKEQQLALSEAMNFAYSLLGHIESRYFAGISSVFLFYGVFGMLETLEDSFNKIWKTVKRGFFKRNLIYLTMIIVAPLIFLASTALTLFLNTEFAKHFGVLEKYTGSSLLKLTPYVLMWFLFSLIYIFTPNTEFRLKTRILAGIVAGTLFQVWQIIYLFFQVHISSYSAVYGTFAALPFFLIWMEINFFILLFGAELAAYLEGKREG